MDTITQPSSRLPFALPRICFGTSPLGDMPGTYGYSVSEDQARETINEMLSALPCFIDTSRNYGMGCCFACFPSLPLASCNSRLNPVEMPAGMGRKNTVSAG